MDLTQIPQYRCHKVVRAAKITGIEPKNEHGITMVQTAYGERMITDSQHPWPEVGGYMVIYGDGYVSFSPAKAFEDGYAPV